MNSNESVTTLRIGYITDLNGREILGKTLLNTLVSKHHVNIIIIGGDCNMDPTLLPANNEVMYYILSGDRDDIYVTKTSRLLSKLLDGTIAYVGNIALAGISGLDYYQNLNKLRKALEKNVRINVLVTHHPPRNCLDRIEAIDKRAGIGVLRDFIIRLKPDLVLTGHLNNRGICYIGTTLVINPGPAEKGFYAVIELDINGKPKDVLLAKLLNNYY